MAKPADIKSCEELEQLLRTYAEQIQELCHLYNTHPKSVKGQNTLIRTAAKQIQKLFKETEDQSINVSSIPTTLESGIEIIKRIIQQWENDSDLVQPCHSQSMPRDLSDTERLDVIQHDQQMMDHMKNLSKHHREPPAVLILMYNNFRIIYHKMGINTASQRQCQTCAGVRDSAEWNLTEPSVILEDAQMKYRLNLKSGFYECSRTGLRIECSWDVKLKYHICDWECVGNFPEMEHFTPCGPLMDIVVISGKLKAVCLPHFLCLGGSPIQDEVRVLHVEDSGISFEKCTLTKFHAKLLNHSFSPKGLLLRSGFSVNYHCETFIYETQKSYLTLHVYLIPSEKKMIEAVENNENKSKTTLISKPGPVSSLQTKTWYSLRTLDENKESEINSEVQPKQLELKYKPVKPDFFEVFIATPKDFHLQLMPQHHNEGVWDAKIRQDDYSQRVSSVADYNQSVSSVDVRESFSSNAVCHTHVHEILLQHLEYLNAEELNLFKWHLTKGVEAFKKIPESKLEKAERWDIVTCMIDQCEVDGAAKLTVTILGKMQKNNDAKQLQEKLDMKATD